MNDALLGNLQSVFNTITTGMLVESAERKVQIVNQRFLNIFGLDGEPESWVGFDCAGKSDTVHYLLKEPEFFSEDVERIVTEAKRQKDLVAFKDGRYFYRNYSPVFENGVLSCHVWDYEEITTLKDKEQELLEQKEFFHKVMDEIPADIAIFSPGHRYIYLNKTAVKNDGIRRWMIGKDDYEYCEMRGLDIDIAHQRRARFNKAKESREATTWVDEHNGPDGVTNYVLRIFYPYINSHNELEFVIGYGVNINHQKQNEQLIEQEKERFSTLIATLNDGVFQITFDGQMHYYNESFRKVMAIEDMDIPKQYQREVMANVYTEDKASLYQAFNRLQETRQPQQGKFRVLHPDTDETSYIEYYIWHRHTAADGDVVAGRLSDVTERELRELHMAEHISKEKELNSMKSHFIHITSHELRTPLSVIMSSAEILEMYDPEDTDMVSMVDSRSLTGGIVREVNRITTILDELLMVGRIESGKIKYEPVWVNVKEYVDTIAAELYMPHDDGRNLQVMVAGDVAEMYADKNLMRHAIVNLVNNAFKYSAGKAAPRLSVSSGNGELEIAVQDFGIGIPEQDKEQLFNSFYRASNVGNISGTGIGLMVVEHVMKTHKGSISIESTQGQGSVFKLHLPMVQKGV